MLLTSETKASDVSNKNFLYSVVIIQIERLAFPSGIVFGDFTRSPQRPRFDSVKQGGSLPKSPKTIPEGISECLLLPT